MKGAISTHVSIFVISLLILLIPTAVLAESPQASNAPPPVAQALIREGTLAIKLAAALNPDLVKSDEATAESWLGEKGISPANGWIADYPVTPVIMGELQVALGNAADNHIIPISRDEALKRIASITSDLAIVNTPADDSSSLPVAPDGENQVDPGAVYDYYTSEGPPVVTYYAPPADYYNLYSWVPYPFWCNGFAFGGFFILNDFHRPVFIDRFHDHDRFHRTFISNHFRDRINNRIVRLDPGGRSNVRFSGTSSHFTRQTEVTSRVRGTTFQSGITRQSTLSAASVTRLGPASTATFQGMHARPEKANVSYQSGGAKVTAGFATSQRSTMPVRDYSPAMRSSASVSSFSSSGSNFNSGRSYSYPAHSFSSPTSSISSLRGNGGWGGGFSSRGSGGFSGMSGGFSGGHGGRR